MSDKYQYSLYKKEDRQSIIKLLKIIWGETVGQHINKNWIWKIIENPFNPVKGPFIYTAKFKGEVVAMMATIPMKFKIKNKIETYFWTIDFVSHPKHRSTGVKVFMKMKTSKFILIGIPNINSYKLGLKIGWFEVSHFYNYINIIRLEKIIEQKINNKFISSIAGMIWRLFNKAFSLCCHKIQRNSGISTKEIFDFGEEMDELWKQVANDYTIIGIRDQKFLKWRYIDIPNKKFKIILAECNNKPVGYVIYNIEERKGEKTGQIVDLLTKLDDTHIFDLLLSEAVQRLAASGVEMINFLLNPYNRAWQRILKKNGFLFKKKRLPILAYIPKVYPIDKKILTNNNWFITGGDSDLAM